MYAIDPNLRGNIPWLVTVPGNGPKIDPIAVSAPSTGMAVVEARARERRIGRSPADVARSGRTVLGQEIAARQTCAGHIEQAQFKSSPSANLALRGCTELEPDRSLGVGDTHCRLPARPGKAGGPTTRSRNAGGSLKRTGMIP